MDRPLTIVEATNNLGIGGVESHVTRLASGFIARGHRVILLTQDRGVHGEEARAIGADVVLFPFQRANRRRAAEALADESIDIIHAHNYRAARFAAPVAAAIDVPYLMTVHGPRPWYQRALFRHWSDPVVTVSEADRENIAGLFGVRRDRVVVSFLGVDTERFRPVGDVADLRAEWGVPRDGPLVVNISRFAHRKARPALALIEALPLIHEQVPEARLVLVGDGPELDRIRSAAAALNAKSGREVARAVGSRTDIPRVLGAADLVVATATTALEALAAGTPTIAYGRTGYLGLVTPANLEDARAICFADHGRGLPARIAARRLAGDILASLTDREAARRAAAELRATVARRYSVERMVNHIEGLYQGVVAEHAS